MRSSPPTGAQVVTVTLNPALDRTLAVAGVRAGAMHRAELLGERPGGKGVNVAMALAEAGIPTTALGFLGEENASVFAAFLAAGGVADGFRRLPGATRVGTKIVDTLGGGTTEFNLPGLAPRPEDLEGLLDGLDRIDARWCVLAGSLPPGVPTDFYEKATRRLRARGVCVALDASGDALAAGLRAGPDLLKPNEHELAALLGRAEPGDEAEALVAARELAAGDSARLVVVSRGEAGAVLVRGEQAVLARPPVLAGRSTVGAGDAMLAGLVAGTLAGRSLADTARLATAFALRAIHGGAVAEWLPRVAVSDAV